MPVIGFDSEIEVAVLGPEVMDPAARYVAQVRESLNSSALLATLSSEGATIEVAASVAVVNPEPGFEYSTTFVLTFQGSVTRTWGVRKVILDLARVDTEPDEYLGFQLEVEFAQTVTRL